MCLKKRESLFVFFLFLSMLFCFTSCEDNSALTGEVEISTEGDVRQIHLNEDSLSVSLSYPDDSSVSIRYTTDESDVTDTSSLYSGPFNISADTTVKAKAFRDSGVASALSERRYYKVTEEFSDKGLLQDRLIELIADDELGPEGDYNHIGLDSSLADLSSLFDNEFLQTFNGDISAWDVSDVSNMSWMFKGAQSFNQPLNDWDVSNVISMDRMFGVAILFNQPLNDWDVCNVESMNSMFAENYSFNQPLNDWDVCNVENMFNMFSGALSFNQPLNNWEVSSVENMGCMFFRAYSFNQPLNDWNVSSVESMSGMFVEANSFNQPLNDWDVSNVSDMFCMFSGASSFNQDISNWKLNSLEVATHMFSSNESFDQDLTGWNDDLPDSVIEYDGIIENCSNMDTTKLPIKLGGSTT